MKVYNKDTGEWDDYQQDTSIDDIWTDLKINGVRCERIGDNIIISDDDHQKGVMAVSRVMSRLSKIIP